jgi:hypothetical protein
LAVWRLWVTRQNRTIIASQRCSEGERGNNFLVESFEVVGAESDVNNSVEGAISRRTSLAHGERSRIGRASNKPWADQSIFGWTTLMDLEERPF